MSTPFSPERARPVAERLLHHPLAEDLAAGAALLAQACDEVEALRARLERANDPVQDARNSEDPAP